MLPPQRQPRRTRRVRCIVSDPALYGSQAPPVAEKERQKAEKAKKFAEKQVKKLATPKAAPKQVAASTPSAEQLPKYVEQTPVGEKKSEPPRRACDVNC